MLSMYGIEESPAVANSSVSTRSVSMQNRPLLPTMRRSISERGMGSGRSYTSTSNLCARQLKHLRAGDGLGAFVHIT